MNQAMRIALRRVSVFGALIWVGGLCYSLTAQSGAPAPYGLNSRPAAQAYLRMPPNAQGAMPARLSETGAFKDVRRLVPSDALIPYELVVPFWSDHAIKTRWISVPTGKTIEFSPTGEWIFPAGTVLVKHFDMVMDETKPDEKRRLETRLIVRDDAGGVYGVTYKWRADNSDADLLPSSLTEDLTVKTATGERKQTWLYPSREDCRTCHTGNAGFVLGVKTRQLNRDATYGSGVSDNQLRTWNHLGLFEHQLSEREIPTYTRLAASDDNTRPLEERARSYLDANCAHCHRPKGTVANFDARFDTPLHQQNLINGPVVLDQGVDRARVITPNDIWRSILFMRANTNEAYHMPPLARNTIDEPGMALLRSWIESLPGKPAQPPPEISPKGGNFQKSVTITLKAQPGAKIHYTTDGSAPADSDPVYEKPLTLTEPTIFRAVAVREGYKDSIAIQEVFVVGE